MLEKYMYTNEHFQNTFSIYFISLLLMYASFHFISMTIDLMLDVHVDCEADANSAVVVRVADADAVGDVIFHLTFLLVRCREKYLHAQIYR